MGLGEGYGTGKVLDGRTEIDEEGAGLNSEFTYSFAFLGPELLLWQKHLTSSQDFEHCFHLPPDAGKIKPVSPHSFGAHRSRSGFGDFAQNVDKFGAARLLDSHAHPRPVNIPMLREWQHPTVGENDRYRPSRKRLQQPVRKISRPGGRAQRSTGA